jgi:hypothetical protein
MLLKQILGQLITEDTHLPLPEGTTHIVVANDISTEGLGTIFIAEDGISTIMDWYPCPAPMDVLYYDLDHKDIIQIAAKLSDITKEDIIALSLEVS